MTTAMIDPKLYTVTVHAGTEPDPRTGAVMTPIYQTSTFVQEAPGSTRVGIIRAEPTPRVMHCKSRWLQSKTQAHAIAFSSGLAAEQAIVHNLAPGDHVLVCNDVYGGTGRLFRTLMRRFGIDFEFADLSNLDRARALMRGNTRMVWLETPTNPTLQVLDIAGLVGYRPSTGAVSWWTTPSPRRCSSPR
jgi:cystathionine beta-lyase/cystathionine gamma-synthase